MEGVPLDVELSRIVQLDSNHDLRLVQDADELLDEFCGWQSSRKFNEDVVILLTRKDICRSSRSGQKEACSTMGLGKL